MSDRFEFRVWFTKESRWATPDDITEIMEPYRWVSCFRNDAKCGSFGFSSHKNTYVIVEQCTGLKDKNGTLIYEGDILHKKGERRDVLLWVCEWDDEDAAYCRKLYNIMFGGFSHECGVYFRRACAKSEVIGNIHENPELLEVEL